MLVDPLTAAAVSPQRIERLTEQMLADQAAWLPRFASRRHLTPAATPDP
jgi:hypothetical protein